MTATAGAVSLKTQANTDASAKANGKADEAGTVGIGAGVSVNSVHITNVATTGNATVSSNGLDVEAGMRVLGTDHIQRFDGSEWKTIESGAAFPESPDGRRLLPADAGRAGHDDRRRREPEHRRHGTQR